MRSSTASLKAAFSSAEIILFSSNRFVFYPIVSKACCNINRTESAQRRLKVTIISTAIIKMDIAIVPHTRFTKKVMVSIFFAPYDFNGFAELDDFMLSVRCCGID
jgi:hypothetical protein